MRTTSALLWLAALAVSTACSRGHAVPPARAPRPGVPQEELALLEQEYSFNDDRCARTAEEVVDMQRQCSEARWADCVYTATMYLRGCGVAQNKEHAEALFQRACGYGSVLGCSMAGVLAKDFERSIALLEKPCALGYTAACGNLGLTLFNRGEEADVARATNLLDKACREDHVYFCGALGKIVIKWKIEPRFAATQTLLEHACKTRDLESCYMLAIALEDGSLGTVDYDRAAALNWSTCHQLDYLPSCNALGYMAVSGRGVEKNPEQGALLFWMACNRGYAPSCDSMGEATEKGWRAPASAAEALPFYDRGCQLGSAHACQRAKELRAASVVPPAPSESPAPVNNPE